jgi:hypothetical protein
MDYCGKRNNSTEDIVGNDIHQTAQLLSNSFILCEYMLQISKLAHYCLLALVRSGYDSTGKFVDRDDKPFTVCSSRIDISLDEVSIFVHGLFKLESPEKFANSQENVPLAKVHSGANTAPVPVSIMISSLRITGCEIFGC